MKIVYKSDTGFTEKYAFMLGKKLGIEAVPLKMFLKSGDTGEIIYMGWLYANIIKGYSKVKDKNKIKCIAAVGMSEENGNVEEAVKKANKLDASAPLFYLRGGVSFQRLKGFRKFIMKAITKSEIKKKRIAGDTEKIFTVGRDYVKEENLNKMIEFLNGK